MFLADKPRDYSIFGKEVDKERFENVWENLHSKLNGWFPKFNNAFELYHKVGGEWKKVKASEIDSTLSDWSKPYEAWKDMPICAKKYICSLEEYDESMFYRITGIKMSKNRNSNVKNDDVEIVVEGKKKVISRKSAIALGLLN